VTFANPAQATFAITSSIVAVQLALLALYTGRVRALSKKWINPEDARLNKGELVEVDHPSTQRVGRAHGNLLENAVPFFVVGALFVATNPSKTSAAAYLWTFVIVRLLHSFFYLFGIQPFRTITFAVGVLAIIGMAVHVVRAAFA
jgi:uncharacterized MAPEG superfamily protein